MKGINYGRFISVYQSQDGGMYYNIPNMIGYIKILLISQHTGKVRCRLRWAVASQGKTKQE